MQIRDFAGVLLGAAAGAAALWSPLPAHACTCSPSPIYHSSTDPVDGAKDVPLNQAVVVEGAFVAGSVTVEDGFGQRVTELTINEGPTPSCPGTWAEIIPKQPWRPQTTYIVRVQAKHLSEAKPEASSLTFVTGSDSLPESELAVPKGHASFLIGLPGGTTCGPVDVMACLNVEGQTEKRRDVEVIARRGDQVLLRTLLPINDAGYGFGELPDCLELRRRSATGERSKPLMLCDLPAMKVLQQSTNWADWPICENGKFVKRQTATPGGEGSSGEPADAPGTGGPDKAGTGSEAAGAQPSAAGDTAGGGAEDAERSSHREYGCAAAPGRPANTTAGWLVLAALAVGSWMRWSKPRRER